MKWKKLKVMVIEILIHGIRRGTHVGGVEEHFDSVTDSLSYFGGKFQAKPSENEG